MYGDTEYTQDRIGVIPFNVESLYYEAVGIKMADESGVSLRCGKFCAHPYVFRLLGVSDEDAYNELVGTDINTWMKVRDWAGIYDAQNLDSTIRYDYLSLSVKSSDGTTFTETAMLGLPSDYRLHYGKPYRHFPAEFPIR